MQAFCEFSASFADDDADVNALNIEPDSWGRGWRRFLRAKSKREDQKSQERAKKALKGKKFAWMTLRRNNPRA